MWHDRIRTFLVEHDFAADRDWQTTQHLLDAVATYRRTHPREGFSRELFDQIVQWKLRGQIYRAADHLAHLNDPIIYEVTGAVFRLNHHDLNITSRVRIEVLQGLPGVGLGVASAILAMYFPESFGVIDFRSWAELHEREPGQPVIRTFTIRQYMAYLALIRPFAAETGKTPQLIDYALWKTSKQRENTQ